MEINKELQERIINAGIDHKIKTDPSMMCGPRFAELQRAVNRNPHFEAGAVWMLGEVEEWLKKIGRTQFIDGLNSFLSNKEK